MQNPAPALSAMAIGIFALIRVLPEVEGAPRISQRRSARRLEGWGGRQSADALMRRSGARSSPHSADKAKQIAEEASQKLLANPVMEYFEISVN